jgi:hypothetical protein
MTRPHAPRTDDRRLVAIRGADMAHPRARFPTPPASTAAAGPAAAPRLVAEPNGPGYPRQVGQGRPVTWLPTPDRADRQDRHNVNVDTGLADQGSCGMIRMATGHRCYLPGRHHGPCLFTADPHPSDLGRRLADRRSQLGLTVVQAAAAAGVDPGYLTYLEERAGWPQMETLLRLAAALRTTVPLLLGAEDPAERSGGWTRPERARRPQGQ